MRTIVQNKNAPHQQTLWVAYKVYVIAPTTDPVSDRIELV